MDYNNKYPVFCLDECALLWPISNETLNEIFNVWKQRRYDIIQEKCPNDNGYQNKDISSQLIIAYDNSQAGQINICLHVEIFENITTEILQTYTEDDMLEVLEYVETVFHT